MPKLSDIAIRTGLNVSTVSRALREAPDISRDTIRHVQLVAQEVGYRYRKLDQLNARSIGVILPEVRSHYYAEIAHAITKEIGKLGYAALLMLSGFDTEKIMAAFGEMLKQDIVGVILSGIPGVDERRLAACTLPTVVLTEANLLAYVDTIFVDSNSVMRQALEHLLALGHERIGYVGEYASDIRYRALVELCRQKEIALDPRFVKRGAERFELGGYLRAKELLQEKELPTAVIASYDQIAFGAMRAMQEAGLSIPRDMSIVGVDDTILGDYMPVKLTTVTNPGSHMGVVAVKLLMDSVQKPIDHVVQRVALQSKLIARESTAPAPNAKAGGI
ncbi:MAG: LacI family transcriptional regulator [Clostridiales bacterium]|nr:LacI family transcriptional regulator [Clostridiales bacterium]